MYSYYVIDNNRIRFEYREKNDPIIMDEGLECLLLGFADYSKKKKKDYLSFIKYKKKHVEYVIKCVENFIYVTFRYLKCHVKYI